MSDRFCTCWELLAESDGARAVGESAEAWVGVGAVERTVEYNCELCDLPVALYTITELGIAISELVSRYVS